MRLPSCYGSESIKQSLGTTKQLEHSHIRDGEGNGAPLQYSRLENPMDGGAW